MSWADDEGGDAGTAYRREIEELKAENKRLVNDLQRLRRRLDRTQREKRAISTSLAKLEAKTEDLPW